MTLSGPILHPITQVASVLIPILMDDPLGAGKYLCHLVKPLRWVLIPILMDDPLGADRLLYCEMQY